MNVVSSQSSDGIQSRPVLILGGSGFIGTRLTALLTEKNIPVQICDLRPSDNTYILRDEVRETIKSHYADVAFAMSNT